jgi:hypothetical protein
MLQNIGMGKIFWGQWGRQDLKRKNSKSKMGKGIILNHKAAKQRNQSS